MVPSCAPKMAVLDDENILPHPVQNRSCGSEAERGFQPCYNITWDTDKKGPTLKTIISCRMHVLSDTKIINAPVFIQYPFKTKTLLTGSRLGRQKPTVAIVHTFCLPNRSAGGPAVQAHRATLVRLTTLKTCERKQ